MAEAERDAHIAAMDVRPNLSIHPKPTNRLFLTSLGI